MIPLWPICSRLAAMCQCKFWLGVSIPIQSAKSPLPWRPRPCLIQGYLGENGNIWFRPTVFLAGCMSVTDGQADHATETSVAVAESLSRCRLIMVTALRLLKTPRWKTPFLTCIKIQHGGRPPFWKRKIAITPPLFQISSPNLVSWWPWTAPYVTFGLQQNPRRRPAANLKKKNGKSQELGRYLRCLHKIWYSGGHGPATTCRNIISDI